MSRNSQKLEVHFQGISRFQPPEVQVASLFRSTADPNCLRTRDWFVVLYYVYLMDILCSLCFDMLLMFTVARFANIACQSVFAKG